MSQSRSRSRKKWWEIPKTTQYAIVVALAVVAVLSVGYLLHTGGKQASDPQAASSQSGAGETGLPARKPVVVFLGDSYTAGVGASASTPAQIALKGYAGLTGISLDADFHLLGQGGTGYTNPGQANEHETTYVKRAGLIAKFKPDLVVIQGGTNDLLVSDTALTQAVTSVLTTIRRGSPRATLVVMSPVAAPALDAAAVTRVTGVLQSAAKKNGASFIDARKWLIGNQYFIADHIHPSDLGHNQLAIRLTPILQKLLNE